MCTKSMLANAGLSLKGTSLFKHNVSQQHANQPEGKTELPGSPRDESKTINPKS